MTVIRLCAALALALSVTCQAFPLDISQPAVQAFADRGQKEGLNRDELLGWLSQVDVKPAIINAMDRPATSRPWFEFAPNFINPKRIGQGVSFWRQHEAVLNRAETTFGVPAAVIVGIIGAESSYGRHTGKWRALDALGTLSFHYPRRADYFQDELLALFQLAREEGMQPDAPLSSFAGALGWPQFMPSNVRTLAVDFDGDGHRNLWGNAADVIGSVAHYLQEKGGWQAGAPIVLPATVSADAETIERLLAARFTMQYTLAELEAMGIKAGGEVADRNAKAILIRLQTREGEQYWLGLQNFYAITRYNKSVNYSMAVWQLGEAVKAALPVAPSASR